MGNYSRGTHKFSINASRLLYDARCKISEFFACSNAENVVFTSGATESLNIAINGIIDDNDHLITTELEHNSVLRPLYRLEKEKNIEINFVPSDYNGNIIIDDFKKLIRSNTKAIICTHVSNVTGNMIDIEKIGKIAKSNNIIFIVDAS